MAEKYINLNSWNKLNPIEKVEVCFLVNQKFINSTGKEAANFMSNLITFSGFAFVSTILICQLL